MASAHAVILAVNIGSSSVKYAAYALQDKDLGPAVLTGSIQHIEPNAQSLESALSTLKIDLETSLKGAQIKAVAHRVVHGGQHYVQSVVVTPSILRDLHSLDQLAPLHQPHNLHGIAAFIKTFPHVPQVACFDTAFHATLAPTEKAFGLTSALYAQGIHRYGFHGLSYQFVSQTLLDKTQAAGKRLLMAHLGSGASLCACVNGKSIATTMGFSAVGGLMMGTRCGDLDPGVVLYLLRQGMSEQALEDLFYRQSGLKGMSEISADMRVLRESSSPKARFAITLFERRVIREAGALIATMGGIDAIAFTGGIGENDFLLRKEVCGQLGFLGIDISPEKNQGAPINGPVQIHSQQSAAEVWVVPTDEGKVAAQQALALL
jgi:acetate kinase